MHILSSTLVRVFIVSIVSFIVYLTTTAPDVGFTDSGELAAVCTTLGVAHPTGYPLYTIIGHAWTLLPLPFSPIYALNVFAGLCVSVSVGIFSWCLSLIFGLIHQNRIHQKRGKNTVAPLSFSPLAEHLATVGISAMYAFSEIIWHQATSNEVYSLQLVVLTLSIALFLRAMSIDKQYRMPALMIWVAVIGLGFGNHGTTILLAPAMIYMFFKRPQEKFDFSIGRWKELFILIIPFSIGLSVWLYLPLRSAALPDFNWGEVHRGFDKFWYHASGKQFQIWMFNDSFSKNFKEFISLLPGQLGYIGIAFCIIGILQFIKRNLTLYIFTTLLFLGCTFYAFNYGIHDIEPYFSLAFIASFIFTAVGVAYSISYIQSKSQNSAIPILITLFIVFINIGLHYTKVDKSADTVVRDYTQIMVEKLPKNTIIFSSQWDYWCSAFWYKQACENLRPDIILIEKELLRRTWYPRYLQRRYPHVFVSLEREMKEFEAELELFESGGNYSDIRLQAAWEKMLHRMITSNYDKYPLYITHDVLQSEQAMMRGYRPVPEGLSYKIVKDGDIYTSTVSIPDYMSLSLNLRNYEGHLYEGMQQMITTSLQTSAYYAEKIEMNQDKLRKIQEQLRKFSIQD
ncbi:MAG: DUF2723 domain-containing protein [Ignavibacteria bacterium]|nr:DUF2723 domain-containing protein [Ignavibacteria bacterium]